MEQMVVVDWLIVGIVLVSVMLSIVRGFVKEAMSLMILVLAVLVAKLFGSQVASMLEPVISLDWLRFVVAFGGLYLLTSLVGSLISYLVYQVVQFAGLTLFNRVLGMVFGFARGALIVIVAITVLSKLPVEEDAWWDRSVLIPYVMTASVWLQQRWTRNFDDLTLPPIAVGSSV